MGVAALDGVLSITNASSLQFTALGFSVNAGQFANARDSILFTSEGQTTCLRFTHPSKALFLIFLTLLCKTTITISVRSLNAISPISLYSSGTVNFPPTTGKREGFARRTVNVQVPSRATSRGADISSRAVSHTKQLTALSSLFVPQTLQTQDIKKPSTIQKRILRIK